MTTTEFAHGTYGDETGAIFYGLPVKGVCEDFLAVSNKYIEPLFRAILDQAWRNGSSAPQVVTEWNDLTGWKDAYAAGKQELSSAEALELVAALSAVSASDLVEHLAGVT